MREYGDLRITKDDGVATIGMLPSGDAHYARQAGRPVVKYFPKHKEVGEAIEELRGDNDVRVIVLTGLGEMFFVPPSSGPGIKAHDPRRNALENRLGELPAFFVGFARRDQRSARSKSSFTTT